jgi:signal transduction histidine kinase
MEPVLTEPQVGSPSKLYAGLSPEELEAAEAIGEIREFAQGETIFRDGEPGDCLYTVLTGKVAVTKAADAGRQQLLANLGPGDYFGEMSVIDSQPRSADASAEEDTTLRMLRRHDLDQLQAINIQVFFNLLRGSVDRLRSMNLQYIGQIVRQEKMSLVGNMASAIIHDFKSPLSVIRINAELLSRDPQNARFAQHILRHVDRVTNMANDLLDFARGTVRLNYRDVEPKQWFAELIELLAPLAARRNVQLESAISTTDHLYIDPDRMTRVIYNLAGNGIEAMTGGGTLRLQLTKPDDCFHIEIADTGPGIPEEIRGRLFEPFVTYGKAGGTGLGTSIAKKIVEDHGGEISFETATGEGTTFHIRLTNFLGGSPRSSAK